MAAAHGWGRAGERGVEPRGPGGGRRKLRGAPLEALRALRESGRWMTRRELVQITGYNPGTISAALRVLMERGAIVAAGRRGPWAAVGGERPRVEIHDSLLPPSPPSSIVESPDLEGEEQELPDQESFFQSNRLALLQAGIKEPAASRLAGLAHMTPEYIRAHVEHPDVRRHGMGTAVYRMTRGWRVEDLPGGAPADPVRARQRQVEEQIRRFIEGR
jgi:DNA-binding transcriptional ArsR family regulator